MGLFLFSDKGFSDSLERIDSDEFDMPPLILGVLGVLCSLDSPTLYLTELTEEVLLLEAVSNYKFLSLAVREGLVSNSFESETLKMESVGILGVDS